jgi:hypothetical protein
MIEPTMTTKRHLLFETDAGNPSGRTQSWKRNGKMTALPGTPGEMRIAAYRPNRLLLVVILVLFLSSYAPALWAKTVSEQTRFKQLLVDIHKQLAVLQTSNEAFPYHEMFTGGCEEFIESPTEGDILREQGVQTGKISGLELKGGYSTGTLTQSEDDGDRLDGGRTSLELSWNLLKEGYRQNALRARVRELQARQADLNEELKAFADANRCRRDRVKKHFAHRLIRLLHLKLQLMEPVYRVERRAYFKNWSFLDDYLVSEEDLILARHELEVLLKDPYYDNSPVYEGSAPILDVDLAGVLSAVRDDSRYEMLFAAEKKRLTTEHDADIRDSLRVYLQKNFDVTGNGRDRDDVIAGLRFTVPLYSRKNSLLRLRIARVERKKNRAVRDRVDMVRNAYASLQEQLHRAVRQQYRQARTCERLRRTLWRVGNDEGRFITTAITRMRTLIESRIELLRAKEELYRRLHDLFLAAQVPYRPDLLHPVHIQSERVRARFGTRGIYIWSDEFNRMKNKDLLAFLEAKQISSVYLSASRKTDAAKRNRFLDQAEARHIDAELIVGDNSWILRPNHEKAIARSVIAAERTGRLHFDIEPQALPDYPENRQDYLDRFVSLVKETKRALLDRTLSVAVPFHWPGETYNQLGTVVDALCVMAYGTDQPEVLIRRIQPLLKTVPADKIVVVLRADDFEDEWEMEQMIEWIVSETLVNRFAIHSLYSFISKTVSPYEIEE